MNIGLYVMLIRCLGKKEMEEAARQTMGGGSAVACGGCGVG